MTHDFTFIWNKDSIFSKEYENIFKELRNYFSQQQNARFQIFQLQARVSFHCLRASERKLKRKRDRYAYASTSFNILRPSSSSS